MMRFTTKESVIRREKPKSKANQPGSERYRSAADVLCTQEAGGIKYLHRAEIPRARLRGVDCNNAAMTLAELCQHPHPNMRT